MKILVTGAHGFIGWHLVHELLDAGHAVRPVDKKPRADDWSGGLFCDILNKKRMEEIFNSSKPEAIIHLAAQPSLQESWIDPFHDAQINILGTIVLIVLAKKYNVKRIVFASTSAVYAPRISGVYPEDSDIGPRTPYGIGKYAAEQYIKTSGISYANLRLGNVYGPRQVPLGENQLIPRALAHIYQGAPFKINGDGTKKRDFVYVKDVTRAFLLAVESEVQGTFNISSGVAHAVYAVLETIKWATQKLDIEFEHGPDKLGELDHVKLVVQRAYYQLKWKAETHLSYGIEKTVEAWPK